MARLQGDLLDSIEHANYYDCIDIARTQNGTKLFGNANIGNYPLTNMQIGGQFGHHRSFVVRRWYARTAIPEIARLAKRPDIADHLGAWSHMATATFVVGTQYRWSMSIADLLGLRPRTDIAGEERRSEDPWPILIPVRQVFQIQIDWQWSHAHDSLRSFFDSDHLPDGPVPVDRPLLWCHLDGFTLDADQEAVQAVLASIVGLTKKREAMANDIAQWILGESKAPELDDAGRAMLQAIADGVIRRAGG